MIIDDVDEVEQTVDIVEDKQDSEAINFALIATNIIWGNEVQTKTKLVHKGKLSHDCPTQFIIDLPKNILSQAKKSDSFNDAIETFMYNFLTHKFGREVIKCQLWYQFDEDALENV